MIMLVAVAVIVVMIVIVAVRIRGGGEVVGVGAAVEVGVEAAVEVGGPDADADAAVRETRLVRGVVAAVPAKDALHFVLPDHEIGFSATHTTTRTSRLRVSAGRANEHAYTCTLGHTRAQTHCYKNTRTDRATTSTAWLTVFQRQRKWSLLPSQSFALNAVDNAS